ncbi:23S rRNA pseudouridine(1911/1915/1917) synthase RluD [Hydromonas duriensis]|uniref:Pseudouridine synthase n=1 Tax=Hydromonas duriensis TaxID=1527608 RepID=A0A4R6Y530_9BURK|nr:23S rRNA pseudouridine(1911/1915/1917) synthase RluD [Hydromonas duriensis]TDR29027.1 ribosomal large subunit pseudouridine synthase D [Hydromonas duriensis]
MTLTSWDENDNDYNAWDDELAVNAENLEPITIEIPEGISGKRLDAVLAIVLPDYSRSRLQKWLKDGAVVCNGEVETSPKRLVYAYETLTITPQPSDEMKAYTPQPMDLDVVYEDHDILVINKPAGLVVHPASGNWDGTLLNGLLHAYPDISQVPRAGIVHRLDKDTSGLMVVAKTVVAQTDLVRQLQARTVKRRYVAIVQGEIDADGVIDANVGRNPQDRLKMAVLVGKSGKPARTFYQSLGFWSYQDKPYSIVVCQLESGRTHQIRVHMQHRGYPLVGDPLYGDKKGVRTSLVAALPDFKRQALHAYQLGLIHPRTGNYMSWQAQLPHDMVDLLRVMGVAEFNIPEPEFIMDALEDA